MRATAWFEDLVITNQRRMVALAYHMLGNLEDARDHAQDAFARLLRLRTLPESLEDATPLLIRILVNLCIDTLRRRNRFRFTPFRQEQVDRTAAFDPARALESQELQAVIAASLQKLRPKQRAVFILRDIEGLSVKETARILKCKENNVLVNLHLARKKMRECLSHYLGVDAT